LPRLLLWLLPTATISTSISTSLASLPSFLLFRVVPGPASRDPADIAGPWPVVVAAFAAVTAVVAPVSPIWLLGELLRLRWLYRLLYLNRLLLLNQIPEFHEVLR
jgi:hypothetical protein